MEAIGDHTVGGHSVPTTWRHGSRQERSPGGTALSVNVSDDAFVLVLRRLYPQPGRDSEEGYVYDLSRVEARWLAWFVFRWMAADWFGLRRWIYYHALHRHLQRHHLDRPS